MNSILSRIPLFADLAQPAATQLEGRMKRREFLPQSEIVREGGAGDAAFFVLSGLVAVRRRDSASGFEFQVAEHGPGEMFGEISLLTGRPRTATVVALEATTCAVLERAALVEIAHQQPDVPLALTAMLADRLDQANRNVGLEFLSLTKTKIDPLVVSLLPQSLLNEHHVVPVAFRNNRLTLGMTNPANLAAIDDVRRVISGVVIEPAAISEDDFRRFMSATYPGLVGKVKAGPRPGGASGVATAGATTNVDLLQSDLIRELQLANGEEEPVAETKQELSASADAPIVRLANSILGLAIKQGASDIHIEPMEQTVTVRFRIDGVLHVVQQLPKKLQLGLISRVKILSRLDIAEKRLPQDGRISATLEDKAIDFRVSTMPGKWGEKVCIRILDKSKTLLSLDKLISHPPTLALVRDMIAQPDGIIFVTGPTGSGKTTTLYAALAELNSPEVNISTAEDPIEYDLAGVTQVQARPDIGLTFANILRTFLRQDPDILLVGETRDKETAHTAVEAALTGHLVCTTLHTNNAAGAFTRLTEMGIEPFLVSASTIGVIAQRLVRKLCTSCREAYVAPEATASFFGLPAGTNLFRGRGCAECASTGLKGRIGVYEVLRMTSRLRQLVGTRARSEEIHAAAVEQGMIELKQYAAVLLTEGLTTVEEVTGVVAVE